MDSLDLDLKHYDFDELLNIFKKVVDIVFLTI